MNVNLHNFKDLDSRLPKFDTTKEYIPEKKRIENYQKALKSLYITSKNRFVDNELRLPQKTGVSRL